jgi:hypothetical protein
VRTAEVRGQDMMSEDGCANRMQDVEVFGTHHLNTTHVDAMASAPVSYRVP